LLVVLGALRTALAQMPNAYGSALAWKMRKKRRTALAEAAKNKWTVAVSIVDAGTLIYYEKMDNTQLGSAEVAIDKLHRGAVQAADESVSGCIGGEEMVCEFLR